MLFNNSFTLCPPRKNNPTLTKARSLNRTIKLKTNPKDAKPSIENANVWLASKLPKEAGTGIVPTKSNKDTTINKLPKPKFNPRKKIINQYLNNIKAPDSALKKDKNQKDVCLGFIIECISSSTPSSILAEDEFKIFTFFKNNNRAVLTKNFLLLMKWNAKNTKKANKKEIVAMINAIK